MSTSPVPHRYPLANQLHHVVNAEPVIPYTNGNSFVSKICNVLTQIFPVTKIVLQCTYEIMHADSITVISVLLDVAVIVATIVTLALTIYSGILYINREASNPIIVVYTSIAAVVGSLLAIASTAYDYKLRANRGDSNLIIITSALIAVLVAMVAYTSFLYKYGYKSGRK